VSALVNIIDNVNAIAFAYPEHAKRRVVAAESLAALQNAKSRSSDRERLLASAQRTYEIESGTCVLWSRSLDQLWAELVKHLPALAKQYPALRPRKPWHLLPEHDREPLLKALHDLGVDVGHLHENGDGKPAAKRRKSKRIYATKIDRDATWLQEFEDLNKSQGPTTKAAFARKKNVKEDTMREILRRAKERSAGQRARKS